MNQSEKVVFTQLFKSVQQKCFVTEYKNALTESEAKHLSNEIYLSTGLILGWKSLKNYSQNLLNDQEESSINPSIPTLDTLVRYIKAAPKTDEVSRKKFESHYPYWFAYKEKAMGKLPGIDEQEFANGQKHVEVKNRGWLKMALIFIFTCLLLFCFFYFKKTTKTDFEEDFTNNNQLTKNGWILKNPNPEFWNKQKGVINHLQLHTLRGDNFEEGDTVKGISNLLVRKINANSFSAELHISDFVPTHNWQQVGIILLEDTLVRSSALRFSLGYNDFFGGYDAPGEIILQVLATTAGHTDKPEEITQTPIFQKKEDQELLIQRNLQRAALRIEKTNDSFRFLYATGEKDIFAFKEIKSKEINIDPIFIGIYASSGNTTDPVVVPVLLDKFIIKGM